MTTKEKLAIDGGAPAKTVPYTKGIRFGKAEEEAAVACIRAQKLWYKQGGTRVTAVEKTICEMHDIKHAVCCSSGTAAVHTALAMCGVEAGDEVIVNPVSDWGSVCGILALGAAPVFADIDEETFSLDPACVEAAVTDKTRAIMLVHLGGYPAHVREIIDLTKPRGIKVIEDCAQSPLTMLDGQPVGTFGDVGAFSTNDSKHVSCGEGGFVITRDDEMAHVARLFIDKGYERDRVRGCGDVRFLGFNYRLTELQAAVLDVQLRGLPAQLGKRRAYGERLIAGLEGIDGLKVMKVPPNAEGAYWFVLTHLELEKLSADRSKVTEALTAEGLACWGALAPAQTLYGTSAIRDGTLYPFRRTGRSAFPGGRKYPEGICPVAERISDSAISLVCSPFYTRQDADETAAGVRKVVDHYRK
ncbi:MAG TPA: DegT/DnrJ/EryC1/StrS family aminotransferase [Phycisphaerae bacterium]|nr:DegT/DnrJ/EryC1/StrS family aminotransferase [Phycisphaerae bacterium]